MANHFFTANDVFDKAQGRWPQILESLGISSSYLKNKHGPCPACGGKNRFRFDDKGNGSFYCNKCGPGYGTKLLQLCFGWSFPYALKMIAKTLGIYSKNQNSNLYSTSNYIPYKKLNPVLTKSEMEKRQNQIISIWHSAKPITFNNPVDNYLKSRGIELHIFPESLRYHPNLPYYDENKIFLGEFPAMLAMINDRNNQIVSIHRTYLGNGCKANVPKPKKLISPLFPGATCGAAIKLFQPIHGRLAIAEGIETALAFHLATQFPIWATISSGGMKNVILPPTATDITIAVDNDASGCGQRSAYNLSQRLLNEGHNVKRVMPPKKDSDFADMLMETSQ